MSLTLSHNVLAHIHAKYAQQKFVHKNDALRDNSVLGSGFSLFYVEGYDYAFIKLRYDLHSANAISPLLYTTRNVLYTNIGVNYKTDLLTYFAQYSYHYTQYNDSALGKIDAREDNYQSLSFSVKRQLFDNLSISTQYEYHTNTSNFALSSYDKHLVTLSLTYANY